MVTNGLGNNRWQLGALLGGGNFGTVYEAVCVNTGQLAVAKRSWRDELPFQLFDEAALLKRVRHPNIIQLYDCYFDEDHCFWVIMERASETLHQAILRDGCWTDMAVARRGVELLNALMHVHNKGIFHRDVHTGNVLLTRKSSQNEPTIKLSDFGCAVSPAKNHGRIGIDYLLRYKHRARAWRPSGHTPLQSDLYDAGLCMYFMRTGAPAIRYEDAFSIPAVQETTPHRRAQALHSPLGRIIAQMVLPPKDYQYKNAQEIILDLKLCWPFLGSNSSI